MKRLSEKRAFHIASALVRLRDLPAFNDTTKEDFEDIMEKVNDSPAFKENTKCEYLRILKRFFLWMATTEEIVWMDKVGEDIGNRANYPGIYRSERGS